MFASHTISYMATTTPVTVTRSRLEDVGFRDRKVGVVGNSQRRQGPTSAPDRVEKREDIEGAFDASSTDAKVVWVIKEVAIDHGAAPGAREAKLVDKHVLFDVIKEVTWTVDGDNGFGGS